MHPNVKLKKSFIDSDRRRNVLFLGHKSAGKATTIQKIVLKEISRLRDSGLAGKDRNKYERVEGKEMVKFGSLKFETESFRYDLLKAPSHHYYMPGLMSKAKQADIAVVILSGLDTDVDVGMKTADCMHMVMSLGITKVLLVVNKADDSGWCESRFEETKSTMLNILKSYGFRDNDLECIPISSKDDLNIHKRTGRGPSLFDALDRFQVGAPAHGTSTFVEKFSEKDSRLKFISDLIKVDLCLDVNNVHAASWYQRTLLLEADDQYLSCEALFESAKKAADNGFVVPTEENNNLVYSLIEGYRSLANKDFNRSVIQFSMVSTSFAKKNNSNAVTCLKMILEKINEEWREETKGKSSVESAEPGNKKEKVKAKNVTKTDIPSATSQVVDVLTSQDYDVDEVVSSGTSCTSNDGENAKPGEYVVPHAKDVKREQYDSTIAM